MYGSGKINNLFLILQMVAATVVTTTVAGSTPTVVIANPANTHLSLPIGGEDFKFIIFSFFFLNSFSSFSSFFSAQILPSGVKGLTQQNIRNTNTVALSQVKLKEKKL